MSSVEVNSGPIVRGPVKDRIGTATRFDIYKVEWESGLKAVLQESDSPFLVAQIHMFFDPNQACAYETAHALEHLMVFGSSDSKRRNVLKYLEKNSYAEAQRTDRTIQIGAEVLPRNCKDLISVLSTLVKKNHYSELALKQEILVLINELAPSLSDILHQAEINMMRRCWPRCNTSSIVNESVERFKSLTLQDIKNFREQVTQPDRIVIGVTGPINIERVVESIGINFSTLKKPSSNPVIHHKFPKARKGVVRINKKNLGNLCAAALIHPLVIESQEDRENITWYGEILCSILNEGWSSSLRLRSRKLGIYNSEVKLVRVEDNCYLRFSFLSNPDTVSSFIDYYIMTLRRMNSTGPSDESVRIAKNLWILNTLRESESLRDRTAELCHAVFDGTDLLYSELKNTISQIHPRAVRAWSNRCINASSGGFLLLYGQVNKVELNSTIESFCS